MEQFIHGTAEPISFGGSKAKRFEPLQQLDLRLRRVAALDLAGAVEHDLEFPFGDDSGIELLERPGGGIPRIGEQFFAGGLTLGVDLRECVLGQIDFAPDFQQRRTGVPAVRARRDARPAVESQGQTANGFEISRDVVAGGAVAARGAQCEQAVFVSEVDRHAIDLRLDAPVEFFVGQEFLHPLDKLPQFLLRIGIVEAHHRGEMLRGFEFALGLSADALAG